MMNAALLENIEKLKVDLLEKGIAFSDDDIAFLDESYSESHRYYHNWAHIEYCLKKFSEVEHLFEDPISVKAALLYHDVIYAIGNSDNEDKSAELAYDTFKSNSEFAERVKALIADTHYGRGARLFDEDAMLMKDIDFSSFARPFEDFWQDIISLNTEEGNQDPQIRIDFYRRILSGEFALFRTAYFQQTYADVVKENIERGIKRLSEL